MTFKFAVGQKVVHVLDEGAKKAFDKDGAPRKQTGLVIVRMAEECWGGVQNYYLIRWYTQRDALYQNGGFLQDFLRMAEIELEAAE